MRLLAVLAIGVASLGCGKDQTATRQDASKPAPSVKTEKIESEPAAAPAKDVSPDLVKVCDAAKALVAAGDPQAAVKLSEVVRGLSDASIKKGFEAIAPVRSPDTYYELARQIAREAGAPGWSCPELLALRRQAK